MAKKEFTAEEKAEFAAKQQEKTEELFKRIDEGVKSVFTSEKYMEYLKFASKFTDYSARNTMLINMQKPDATYVAAYGLWKKLGRYVDKGEAGIQILAPVKYETNQYVEFERPVNDEFGNQLYNDDGTEKTEIVQQALTGLAFKPAYVFDLSQTNGKDIPDLFTEMQGDIDAAKKEAIFKALQKVTGIDFEFKDIQGGSKGYYSPLENQIVIKTGMSDLQTIKTAIHETAHNLLHDPDKKIVTAKSPRNEKEVHAESVAFMVAERFGMDTSEYSFPYIASWSEGKQKSQLMKALQEIQTASKTICDSIEWELLKMRKRGLSMEEKLTDTELNNIQKAEFIIEDCNDRAVFFSYEETQMIMSCAGDNEDILETVKLVSDIESIQKQRINYGYEFDRMIPFVFKKSALEAFDNGEEVYLLFPDNSEEAARDRSEIERFDGFFGMKRPDIEELSKPGNEFIRISKETALEMWKNGLDVFIDGVPAISEKDIQSAASEARIFIADYQYAAEIDFDATAKTGGKENKMAYENNTNNKIIGNTPYNELGGKSELQYYSKLPDDVAQRIVKQLDADKIRFSGVIKPEGTTITINKADVPKYGTAVKKVRAGFKAEREQVLAGLNEYNAKTKAAAATRSPDKNDNIIGNTAYAELGGKNDVKYYTGLTDDHADRIGKQLDADGIRYSGLRKDNGTTTLTINKADIQRYEAAVEKLNAPAKTENKNPNIIGNTSYAELGGRSELEYYTNLKNRHADRIAEQLNTDGVRFSGVRKGTVTTITINKADIPKYEAAVEKVKAFYAAQDERKNAVYADKPNIPKAAEIPERQYDKVASFKDVPICTMSFLEAHQTGNIQAVKDSRAASQACIKYINDNLYEKYESRDLKGLVNELDEKFGLDRAMYTLAATIQLKSHDGRFTAAVKERADRYFFDSDDTRINFLTEQHSVKVNHLYETLMDRERELTVPQKSEEPQTLPPHLADKWLITHEHVDLIHDERGVCKTDYYQTSAEQFMVEGLGWLDNAQYDNAQRESGLNAKEFYDKVTAINISCIDNDGKPCSFDVSKNDYDLLQDKSYSPKNKPEYEAVVEKFNKRAEKAVKKPSEYYALSQISDYRFQISTISPQGTIVPVKKDIPGVPEANRILTQIFTERKASVRCEIVHPQDLGKIAEEIRKNLKPHDMEIYQLKNIPENRDIMFSPVSELLDAGKKPDFSNYEKVYDCNLSNIGIDEKKDITAKLDEIYEKFNIDRPKDFTGHSLSISDVVVMNDKAYYVDRVGYAAMTNFLPPEREKRAFEKELLGKIAAMSTMSDEELSKCVKELYKTAQKLGIEPAVIRKAFEMSQDKRAANIPEHYERAMQKKELNRPDMDRPNIGTKKNKKI